MAACGLLRPPSASIRHSTLQRLAATIWPVLNAVAAVRNRMPGVLIPARLAARFKPLRFRTSVPSPDAHHPPTIDVIRGESRA
jgi:hypothetical protein